MYPHTYSLILKVINPVQEFHNYKNVMTGEKRKYLNRLRPDYDSMTDTISQQLLKLPDLTYPEPFFEETPVHGRGSLGIVLSMPRTIFPSGSYIGKEQSSPRCIF